jgi:RNA polymerase sigma-70 factor (ECF subfamily)
MPDEQADFAALVARARQGDQAAITQLVQQYEPVVRRVARAQLAGPLRTLFDSTDLVDSVHRSVLVGLRTNQFDISSPKGLITLAVTMVNRKIALQWRRLKSQERCLGKRIESGSVEARLLSLYGSPDDPAKIAALREFLQTLDSTEQRLIELRLEGYSMPEIAPMLGLSVEVLRVRLNRLRRHLLASGMFKEWL